MSFAETDFVSADARASRGTPTVAAALVCRNWRLDFIPYFVSDEVTGAGLDDSLPELDEPESEVFELSEPFDDSALLEPEPSDPDNSDPLPSDFLDPSPPEEPGDELPPLA